MLGSRTHVRREPGSLAVEHYSLARKCREPMITAMNRMRPDRCEEVSRVVSDSDSNSIPRTWLHLAFTRRNANAQMITDRRWQRWHEEAAGNSKLVFEVCGSYRNGAHSR